MSSRDYAALHHDGGKPGAFSRRTDGFSSDDDDEVEGFVYSAKGGVAEVMFFKPKEMEMREDMEFIAASIPDEILWAAFEETVRNAIPEIKEMWRP